MSFQAYLNAFLDLIFPPRCTICQNISPQVFCDNCQSQIKYLDKDSGCVFCGMPKDTKFQSKSLLCRNCTRERPHFDLARSVALYDGVIRKAIHNFKFNGKTALAEHLAKIMTNHIQHHLPEIKYCHADVIVTVPLSARRLKERGYNQVDLIAEVLAKDLNLPHEKMALKRAKETNAQFNLSRQERRSNIAGAFEVDDIASILGKRILLLDDIYTTGLTINECAKALKQKGAAKIYALTLSRAVLD